METEGSGKVAVDEGAKPPVEIGYHGNVKIILRNGAAAMNIPQDDSHKTVETRERVESSDDEGITQKYVKGEKIFAMSDGYPYRAKVLEVFENGEDIEETYMIHYDGWNKKFDHETGPDMLMKINEANTKIFKEKQKKLREMIESNKDTKFTLPAKPRGKKRAFSSTENTIETLEEKSRKIDVFIKLAQSCHQLLVHDWEEICKNEKLIDLPRKPSVDDILSEYTRKMKDVASSKKSSKEALLDASNADDLAEGVRLYFNSCLGTLLLYHFERRQYQLILEAYPNQNMGSLYGAEHLLRLLSLLPELIGHSSLEEDAISILARDIESFGEFIDSNQAKYFKDSYSPA